MPPAELPSAVSSFPDADIYPFPYSCDAKRFAVFITSNKFSYSITRERYPHIEHVQTRLSHNTHVMCQPQLKSPSAANLSSTELPSIGLRGEAAQQQHRSNLIEGPLLISGFAGGKIALGISRLKSSDFSAASLEQHSKECEFDISAMQHNLRRLKIRLLGDLLAGQGKQLISIADKRTDDSAREITSLLEKENRQATKEESSKIIEFINQKIPEELKLSHTPVLNREEANEIYKLWLGIRYGDPIKEDSQRTVSMLLKEVISLQKKLTIQDAMQDLFDGIDGPQCSRRQLQQVKDEYRRLLKLSCATVESVEWQSPSLGGSTGNKSSGSECGDQQYPRWMQTDYQRWGMASLDTSERELHKQIFRPTTYSEYAGTLLFNSGMNAFHSALDLARWYHNARNRYSDSGIKPLIASTPDVYFEYNRAVSQGGFNSKEITDTSASSIIKFIKENKPAMLILAPIGLGLELPRVDVSAVIEELHSEDFVNWMRKEKSDGRYKLLLLIDNTATGSNTDWVTKDFSELPKGVNILTLQSLIKNHQDGMDLSFLGAITIIGEHADSDLGSIRRRMSTLPSPIAIRETELALHKDSLSEKLRRHERNAHLIAKSIEESIKAYGEESLFGRVIYPSIQQKTAESKELGEASTGGGPILHIEFNYPMLFERMFLDLGSNFIRDDFYILARAYRNVILALAKEVDIEINEGTSYGFDRTRLCMYERRIETPAARPGGDPDSASVPYFRIAAGTEPAQDAKLVAKIFARANDIVSRMLRLQEFHYCSSFQLAQRDTEIEAKANPA